MTRGRFKRYQHDHYFYEMDDRTVLNDKIRFTMPLGPLGRLVGQFVLVPYLARRLRRRLVLLRRVAETNESGRSIFRSEERVAIRVSVYRPEFLGE